VSDSAAPPGSATEPAAATEAVQATARAATVAAARDSYGRLVAWLAWQWRDIAAAEDAMAEAFAAALEHWPRDGVPSSPEGWLLTTAKRHLMRQARRGRLARDPTLTVLWPDADTPAPERPPIPDDRLRLMFVCAHPAIDPPVRSALMLQVVLGVDAARIATAWLVSPDAMTKRLVRAKAKIRVSGVRFEIPGVDELDTRLHAVLEAIYGAYTLHTDDPSITGGPAGLADEAVFLARLVVARLPDAAEARGLLALLLFCEARRPARLDVRGRFVPLDRQDTTRWSRPLLDEAEAQLAAAATLGMPGPFQLEAAIQAAHCRRVGARDVPWSAIVHLYERLLACAPTVGARIGHAVAVARTHDDPQVGLTLLDGIDARVVARTSHGGRHVRICSARRGATTKRAWHAGAPSRCRPIRCSARGWPTPTRARPMPSPRAPQARHLAAELGRPRRCPSTRSS
jgi:RNA polymerase sigma-70 factor (ECF subfamily)